jgi:hypothetical protein
VVAYSNRMNNEHIFQESNVGDFHGGVYEELSLLGYKTEFVPHRKHYVSAKESS